MGELLKKQIGKFRMVLGNHNEKNWKILKEKYPKPKQRFLKVKQKKEVSDVKVSKKIVSFVDRYERLFIEPTDGTKTIFKSTELFKAGIDSCFGSCELNKPGLPTEKIFVDLYKVNKEETLLKTFSAINSNFEEISLEQSQIIDFCLSNPDLFLRSGLGTLFLMRMDKNFFPVLVATKPNGLEVLLYNLCYEKNVIYQWIPCKNLRIIVPNYLNLDNNLILC